MRDKRVKDEFALLGWRVIVIWECEVKGDLQNARELVKKRMEIK